VEFDPIFEESPVAMALVDPNGTIRRANCAFADWAGVDRAELPSRNWWNLVSPADLGRALTRFGCLMQGQESQIRFEARISAAQGKWRVGVVWCKPMGQSVLLQILDGTARVEAGERIAALQTEIAGLTSEVATQRRHLGSVAALLAELASPRAVELEETCRLASQPLARQVCDLGGLVERAVHRVQHRIPAMEAVWSIAEMPPVSLDAAAVSAMLEQLLEDAAQSAGDRRLDAGAYFRNGTPVLFFRYEARPTDDKPTGVVPDLGPPRRLAERHGGDCWVEQDHGRTTICLTFESATGAA
jgi:PAS domain S-box-containing protein